MFFFNRRDISGANVFNKGNTSTCSTAEFNSISAKLHVAIVDQFLQLDFISLMFHLCQDHWTSMPSDESDEPFWTSLNQQYPSTIFSSNIMHLLHLCRRHPIWFYMSSVHDVGKGVPIVRSTASLQSAWCICKTQNISQPNQPLLSLKIWPAHQWWMVSFLGAEMSHSLALRSMLLTKGGP